MADSHQGDQSSRQLQAAGEVGRHLGKSTLTNAQAVSIEADRNKTPARLIDNAFLKHYLNNT
jgi:hypothetical protein